MDPMVNMQALGERLLLLRRRADLSQSALAHQAGLDVMTVSRIESGGKKRLELETVARLARVFGVTLDRLCGLETSAGEGISAPSVPACPELDPALVTQQWPKDERELAAQILCWHDDEGITMQAIVRRLNAAGVPTRSGRGQWYQASVSELLRQHIPKAKKDRKDFMATYGPGRSKVAEATAPQPTPHPKRQRTRKDAPVA